MYKTCVTMIHSDSTQSNSSDFRLLLKSLDGRTTCKKIIITTASWINYGFGYTSRIPKVWPELKPTKLRSVMSQPGTPQVEKPKI